MYERIQRAIDYVEKNLMDELQLKEVSSKAFCSLSYFHSLFKTIAGISLKEYIRKRRLTCAAYDLVETNEKIIDLAYKYQYESHESFTRAFTKMFGMTPSMYRRRRKHVIIFQKINILQMKLNILKGGYFMEPEIIDVEEIKVIGIELRTSFDDAEYSLAIKELWNRYINEKIGDSIPNQMNPYATLGVNMDFNQEGDFSYLICKEVNSFSEIPQGMVGKTIPKSKYAIFTATGKRKANVGSSLGRVWNYFFTTWLPQSGYTQKGISSPNSPSPYDDQAVPDFELYDERFTDEGFEVDVYIPIQ